MSQSAIKKMHATQVRLRKNTSTTWFLDRSKPWLDALGVRRESVEGHVALPGGATVALQYYAGSRNGKLVDSVVLLSMSRYFFKYNCKVTDVGTLSNRQLINLAVAFARRCDAQ